MSADPGPDPSFEAFLSELPPSLPDPVYRELARAAFLGRPSRAADSARTAGPMTPPMTPRGSEHGQPTDSDFERWLRERSPAPTAAVAFRDRMRRRFLSAVLAEEAQNGGRPGRDPTPRGWRRWVVPVLAAAAIVAVTLVLPEPLRWKAGLRGPARFAGANYAPHEEGRFAVDLEQSGLLESDEEPVHLVLAGSLELEVRPHTRLELPPLPELDGVTPIDLGLLLGEVYVRTAPSYPGNPIRISTLDAQVEVLGTTLGVLCEDGGTCVCVSGGSASVESRHLPLGTQRVASRHALFLHREAEPEATYTAFAELAEGGGAHVEDLLAFHGSELK